MANRRAPAKAGSAIGVAVSGVAYGIGVRGTAPLMGANAVIGINARMRAIIGSPDAAGRQSAVSIGAQSRRRRFQHAPQRCQLRARLAGIHRETGSIGLILGVAQVGPDVVHEGFLIPISLRVVRGQVIGNPVVEHIRPVLAHLLRQVSQIKRQIRLVEVNLSLADVLETVQISFQRALIGVAVHLRIIEAADGKINGVCRAAAIIDIEGERRIDMTKFACLIAIVVEDMEGFPNVKSTFMGRPRSL